MAQKILLKRGLSQNLNGLTLDLGEPAVALDTGKLYIGDSTGDKILVNPDKALEAGKLSTARNFSISGDASADAQSFDGTKNMNLVLTLANSGVTAGTYTKLTVDQKGRVIAAEQITPGDIPTLTLSKISDAGTAAKANTGTAEGNVPVLGSNGKLPSSTLPPIAITETFVVSSQAAMLSLSGAEVGDIAIRTDINKSFVLKGTNFSILANWQELLTPTDTVLSVNGQTGTVEINDITGNAATADKLKAPRTITASGAATGSVSFDGSTNANLVLTLANLNWSQITAGKPSTLAGYGITDAMSANAALDGGTF